MNDTDEVRRPTARKIGFRYLLRDTAKRGDGRHQADSVMRVAWTCNTEAKANKYQMPVG
jgi:hypothetical protein